MLIFGYPIITFFPLAFSLNTTPFNIAARAIYSVISVYLIASRVYRNEPNRYNWTYWGLTLFLFFYSLRIVYDVQIRGIVFEDSVAYLYIFSFLGSFMPFFAISMNVDKLDYKKFIKYSYLLAYITCILIFILIFIRFKASLSEILAERLNFYSKESEGNSINPITISIAGAFLGALSIYHIYFIRVSGVIRILYFLGMGLGITFLIFGASRGPLISFSICVIYLLYVYLSKKASLKYIKQLALINTLLIVGCLIYILVRDINWADLSIYNRLIHFGESSSLSDTSTRINSWGSAWRQFLSSPFVGDSYLESFYYSYPHNIYLEVLMALGLLGIVLFYPIILRFFAYSIKTRTQLGIYIIYLLYMIESSFSGGLFINPPLWGILALMTGFKKMEKYD